MFPCGGILFSPKGEKASAKRHKKVSNSYMIALTATVFSLFCLCNPY